MKNIKFIVNADDYGMLTSIDNGILEAIDLGRVSSVSVLMNFEEESYSSQEALKKLILHLKNKQLLGKVGIGIHLNITTGKPLSKNELPSIVNSQTGNFYTIDEIGNRYSGVELSEIKQELIKQIEAFLEVCEEIDEGIKIDHFNSQHNVLQSVPEFAVLLAYLSSKYRGQGHYPTLPIPIRRPTPMMMEFNRSDKGEDPNLDESSKAINVMSRIKINTVAYLATKNLLEGNIQTILYKVFTANKKNLLYVLNNIFRLSDIRSSEAMFFCFYGHGNVKKSKRALRRLKENLNLFASEIRKKNSLEADATIFIEIIHHLGGETIDEQRATTIMGLDFHYYKKLRKMEMELISSTEYAELLDKVELAKHSDMNAFA